MQTDAGIKKIRWILNSISQSRFFIDWDGQSPKSRQCFFYESWYFVD